MLANNKQKSTCHPRLDENDKNSRASVPYRENNTEEKNIDS
jgi:hypothetical protein